MGMCPYEFGIQVLGFWIYGSGFNAFVQDLVEWRQKQGYVVYLIPESEAGSSANEIKSYLKEIVESNNCGKWFKNNDYIKKNYEKELPIIKKFSEIGFPGRCF